MIPPSRQEIVRWSGPQTLARWVRAGRWSRRVSGILFFGSGLLVAPAALRADLELQFNVTQETDRPASKFPEKPASKTREESSLTVVLGKDYFRSESSAAISLVDFSNRKSVSINRTEKVYTISSLYSEIGFRVAEFPNRLMQQKILAAGGVKENPFEVVLMEHLFSLRAPEAARLVPREQHDSLSYSHEEKPLFSRSASSGHALSEAEATQFTRYLRYAYPMHPDILAAIQAGRSVPTKFEVHRYNFGIDHIRFAFVKAREVPRRFDLREAVSGLREATTELTPLCAAAEAITPAAFRAKCDALLQDWERLAKEQKVLEAVLSYLEFSLSSGRQAPNVFTPFADAIQADPATQLFLGALQPRSKEAALKAVDTMRALEEKTVEGRRVLRIHQANHLTAAGQPREARKLFQQVLAENPCIVGAWKDLGDLYYRDFQPVLAWRCWDAGRGILREQPQFKPVFEFERKLETDHPEFF